VDRKVKEGGGEGVVRRRETISSGRRKEGTSEGWGIKS